MSVTARIALFLTTVLAIWLGAHLYVGWRLLGLLPAAVPALRTLVRAILIAGFVAYPAGRLLWRRGLTGVGRPVEWAGAAWIGTVFLLAAGLLAAEVLTAGGLLGQPWTGTVRTAAVACALAAAAAALAGGHRPPRLVEVAVPAPGLDPALDGFTIVQLSDLHIGSLLGERFLEDIAARVDALAPDLLVITGDLFDNETASARRLLPALRRLSARRRVLAVTGNHEYYAGVAQCTGAMEAAGFEVLHNRWVEAAPGLAVAGVPDDGGARQTGRPGADLGRALEGIPAGWTVVLLQHAPEREAEAAAAGVDLMLDGHTHGGQIWPFHLLVRRFYPHLAGVFRVGAMTQVVSRGAGRWGPPMRLLAPADIVRITLRPAAGPPCAGPPSMLNSAPRQRSSAGRAADS